MGDTMREQIFQQSNRLKNTTEDVEIRIKKKSNKIVKGKVILLNEVEFKYEDTRCGSDADADNLEKRFKLLGYEVTVLRNIKIRDLIILIEGVIGSNYSGINCFIFIILSHGYYQDMIYMYDGMYPLKAIISRLAMSKSLEGIPKLFFIQACRGKKFDAGHTLKYDPDGILTDNQQSNSKTASPSRLATDSSYIGKESTENDEPDSSQQKPFSNTQLRDTLIVQSTVKGFYSWRNVDYGSWFIQELCYALENHSKTDVLTMLTLMNRRIALVYETQNAIKQEYDEKKQVSVITSTLSQPLYL